MMIDFFVIFQIYGAGVTFFEEFPSDEFTPEVEALIDQQQEVRGACIWGGGGGGGLSDGASSFSQIILVSDTVSF